MELKECKKNDEIQEIKELTDDDLENINGGFRFFTTFGGPPVTTGLIMAYDLSVTFFSSKS
jgi:bacteriocin-like protein